MNIKIFNCVLTFDEKQKTTVILSSDNENIILPNFNLIKPSYIKEEIKYFTKSLFYNTEIKLVETIVVSTLEIQNDFLINYIKNIEKYNYDENQDLCIFSSIVLSEKFNTSLHWLPVDFNVGVSDNKPINLLIDYVFKNTLS
jgi:hypothetical protein